MPRSHGVQLFARDRVASQHRPLQLQRGAHREHIVSEAVRGVAEGNRRWRARRAEAAPRDALNVVLADQLGCEFVEDVRSVSEASQEN
jgi:hypothetical protein